MKMTAAPLGVMTRTQMILSSVVVGTFQKNNSAAAHAYPIPHKAVPFAQSRKP